MKPLRVASLQQLRGWFWLLLLANILYIISTKIILQPLTPGEMARFEIAKKVPAANDMITIWKLSGKYEKAVQNIYVDYLFIILYTAGLTVACVFLSRLTKHEILMKAGRFFSYLLLVAGICDIIENIAMMNSLRHGPAYWSVMTAYDMAATKFSIIIVSLLFLLVCVIFWLLDKVSTGRSRHPILFL